MNDERLLIQVVPRLTPTRCGVTDHAVTLAGALRSSFGVETAFVIVNSYERCELPHRIAHCSPGRLLQCCRTLSGKRRSALLVHVSGYGYSSDGAPKALANALAQVRDSGHFAIGAYFHELYYQRCTPWKKAFWYSHKQRREVMRIAEVCDTVLTNTTHHGSWLQNVKQSDAKLHVLPVFSNIGESADFPTWNQRSPALIVFGQTDTRQQAYEKLKHLSAVLERLGIREILDVGAEADAPEKVGALEVRRMGRMPAAELGSLISSTQFGFVRFAPNGMAKSSVMAALCALGAVPVLAESFEGEIDGISDGTQVITPNSVERASFADCSRAAWQWYQQHNVNAHARAYADWLADTHSLEVAVQ